MGYRRTKLLPQIKGKKGKAREWVFCHYDSRFGTSGSKMQNNFSEMYDINSILMAIFMTR